MQPTDKIIKFSAILSVVEMGIGGLLHGLRLPLSGQLLSLNQGFILTRALQQTRQPKSALLISNSTAVLKALSPLGKRLTPMLAITSQGVLFYLGALLPLSIAPYVGMTLLTLWAFLQPVILYYIMFGQTLVELAQYFLEQIKPIVDISVENVVITVFVMMFIKVLVGVALVRIARKMSEADFDEYVSILAKYSKRSNPTAENKPWLRQVFKELFRPMFILTLILTATFLFITKPVGVSIVWMILRPIAVGFLVFGLIKLLPIEKFLMSSQAEPKTVIGKMRRLITLTLSQIKSS